MNFIVWFLRLLGLTQLAAALEAYRAQGQVESNRHAEQVNQEVQDEKDRIADLPDDALDAELDRLRSDAISRNDSNQ